MGKVILIADDEETIREPLREMLVQKGYEVLEAGDGKKALDEVKKKMPNLVILDVNMPKMDGFKVLENLKKDRKTADIPVFMLTSRSSAEDIAMGISGFAEKYIPKPFDFTELLSEIEKTLRLH